MSGGPDSLYGYTEFAPAGRTTDRELAEQVRRSMEDPCVQVVLEAVHGFLLILNSQRQILAANSEVLEALHREEPGCLIGLRPGEAFNCVHFTEGPEGCGTSKHCRTCGAVLSILASQASGKRAVDECRLSALEHGKLVAHEFRVSSTPVTIGGEQVTAFVLHDISDEKRRLVLEQTFLHDFLNSLGGISGWSTLLGELDPGTASREILALAETLKDEVYSHRTLLEAESGDLVVNRQTFPVADLLEQLRVVFSNHPTREGKHLEVGAPPDGSQVFTDRALLLRVLINMVKNAFEASAPGGAVRVWFERREGRPGFVVHNHGVITPEAEAHIFERSFSTKGSRGHGIGTYSMKLFGENYLGGTVSYTSSSTAGTSFYILLPADVTAPASPAETAAASGGRVLLVEDDEALSRLAVLFLERLGYTVVACPDGVEAEEIFRDAPGQFDLVITDSRMPRMNGLELVRRLHQIRPDVPIFLSTGATSDPGIRQAMGAGMLRDVIAKPYTLPTLAQTLRKGLAGSR